MTYNNNDNRVFYDLRDPEIIQILAERYGKEAVHRWLKDRLPSNFEIDGTKVYVPSSELDEIAEYV